MEPHKAGELGWFPLDALPADMVPYVRQAIERWREARSTASSAGIAEPAPARASALDPGSGLGHDARPGVIAIGEDRMAAITMREIRKSFGTAQVIKGVDLAIQDKEFVVFVGPSGCGKSTLLRLVAGLEDITAGRMLFDGEEVNDLPPAERGIAMVFQSYALYPHMSVYENMAFGLKLAKVGSKEGIDERVRNAARILQIEHLLERKPKQLSGGQRQRVAIGRAIVREPRVFLFDEPLSNLDAALRVQMRIEIAKLHHDLDATMIYVTHDQVEAMTLADRIVVLNAGVVEQFGSPLELYHQPAEPVRRRLHRLAEDELRRGHGRGAAPATR